MNQTTTRCLSLIIALIFLNGCATPKGDSPVEKKAYVRETLDKVLVDLYRFKPELKQKIKNAEGYAVFDNLNVKIFFVGTGHGFGMVFDNKTGNETFMRMAEVGAGIGFGIKDLRIVFVFHSRDVMDQFVESGWEFGANADATAIAGGDKGVSASGQATLSGKEASIGGEGKSGLGGTTAAAEGAVGSGIEIYQLTENGIALQAMVSGTKYWKDRKLN